MWTRKAGSSTRAAPSRWAMSRCGATTAGWRPRGLSPTPCAASARPRRAAEPAGSAPLAVGVVGADDLQLGSGGRRGLVHIGRDAQVPARVGTHLLDGRAGVVAAENGLARRRIEPEHAH